MSFLLLGFFTGLSLIVAIGSPYHNTENGYVHCGLFGQAGALSFNGNSFVMLFKDSFVHKQVW